MTASTHETFILIQPSHGGVQIRTAKSLKELIEDILTNSGPEIAAWAPSAAAVAAKVWRDQSEREAFGVHNQDCECGDCECGA